MDLANVFVNTIHVTYPAHAVSSRILIPIDVNLY
jgi:hypothetical protein